MMRSLVVAVVGGLVLSVGGMATAGDKAAAKGAPPKAENCGAMMKGLVPLPTKFAGFMTTIADGMTAHANWVGMGKDAAAKAESAAMMKIAQDHRDLAAAAKKTAADMSNAATLAPVVHDNTKMDPKVMGEAMLKQAALEKEMAAMMIKDAEETEKHVAAMSKPAAK